VVNSLFCFNVLNASIIALYLSSFTLLYIVLHPELLLVSPCILLSVLLDLSLDLSPESLYIGVILLIPPNVGISLFL